MAILGTVSDFSRTDWFFFNIGFASLEQLRFRLPLLCLRGFRFGNQNAVLCSHRRLLLATKKSHRIRGGFEESSGVIGMNQSSGFNIMYRLNSSAQLMIVSDLDYTMVDHDDPENLALLKFNALWEAYYRHDSLLVFSTGRSPTIYKQLRKEKPILTPDITVLSVGTEIMYGESMVQDHEWEQYLDKKWNRNIVTEETAKFPELTLQPETEQRPHKVSFYVEKVQASKIMKALTECLEKRGLDVKIIYSGSIALDVLPKGAGKGQALSYLLKKFQYYGKPPANTLVCGDSGNDAELFSVPDVYGVMVSNAQEELLQWHAENAGSNPNIIHASERCAAGIVQAIGNFGLGPNISPRDISDLPASEEETFNPGLEVVKFYLFYERWKRAEVQKSELSLQKLRSVFYPPGIFIHPSGFEQHLNQYIDGLGASYGDRQGTNFRVWLDRVSLAQIGADAWLVKFDKWELSGDKRERCLTTVLLSSKVEVPDGFRWMHVHQTWLDGSGKRDQISE